MANRVVDDAFKHVKSVMESAKKELSGIQSAPVGRDVRSKKEIGIMMKKFASLSEEERNSRMDEIIALAGHKDYGDGCGMCEMVKEYSSKS